MGLGTWLTGLAGLAGLVAIGVNLPTRLWMPADRATLKYLAATTLQKLDGSGAKFKEASELSSLLPHLRAAEYKLYAVVHEKRGVEEFRPFFKGDIFLDEERRFYGPRERWMFLSGILRPSVWMNMKRASDKQVPGDLKGEGRLLGGVFVIGAGEGGVLLEHRESEWGDHVNTTDVVNVIGEAAPNKPAE